MKKPLLAVVERSSSKMRSRSSTLCTAASLRNQLILLT